MNAAVSEASAAPAVDELPTSNRRKSPVWGIISLRAGRTVRLRLADIAGMWSKVWLIKVFAEGEARVLVGDEIDLAYAIQRAAPRLPAGCKVMLGTEEMTVKDYMANTTNLVDSILVFCPHPVWRKMKREHGDDLNFRELRRMPR